MELFTQEGRRHGGQPWARWLEEGPGDLEGAKLFWEPETPGSGRAGPWSQDVGRPGACGPGTLLRTACSWPRALSPEKGELLRRTRGQECWPGTWPELGRSAAGATEQDLPRKLRPLIRERRCRVGMRPGPPTRLESGVPFRGVGPAAREAAAVVLGSGPTCDLSSAPASCQVSQGPLHLWEGRDLTSARTQLCLISHPPPCKRVVAVGQKAPTPRAHAPLALPTPRRAHAPLALSMPGRTRTFWNQEGR